jgi:1-acyl-sn-glycerol-3-phosphate acyltransferase
MKGFDYSKITEGGLYDIMRPVGKLLGKMLYKIEYVGTENIPENGGFILASNHVNALDPVFIALGMKNRQLHFMSKKELFKNPISKYFLSKLNGFPIVRGGADSEALDYAIRIVKEGFVLGMFPEGTRAKDFKPAKAKSGVAAIAREAKADILPVSIYTSDDMKKGTKLTIRYGELIPYESLGINEESSRAEIKECAQNVMGVITKLWEMGHCE